MPFFVVSILGRSMANVMHITGATTGGNARFQFITHDGRRGRPNRDDDTLLDELLQVRARLSDRHCAIGLHGLASISFVPES